MKKLLIAAVGAGPACWLKNALLRRLGWTIGKNVWIGPGLFLGIDAVVLLDGVRIGPFNVIRDVRSLHMRSFARLGQWNWISAAPPLRSLGGSASLVVGDHSAVTSRHYMDVSGGLQIGRYSTIAGVRSTFVTHGINWKESVQTVRPIEIGDYCLISSNVEFAPGASVGDKIVVGMGATVSGQLMEAGLYVQPRAQLVKQPLLGNYFERETGFVGTGG